MKKLLLISLYEDISSIGIRYLSAFLKSNGIDVTLIHMQHFSEKSGKYVYKMDSEKNIVLLKDKIKRYEPDLIGIGVMTNYFKRAVNISREIKKTYSIPIVFGGMHPSLCPEECLEFADIVCIGEAEETLLELCRVTHYPKGLSKIQGIAYKKDQKIIKNEIRPLEVNLDKYPFPDYSFDNEFVIKNNQVEQLDKNNILKVFPRYLYGKTSYRIMTSRGCPYACSYCCNYTLRKMWKGKGKYLRGRSVDNVINEMIGIKKNIPIESFRIMDDSFLFYSLDWFKEFNKEYKEKIGLPFSCLSSPRNVSYDKLKLLVDCGLSHIQLGLQTGSEKINFDIYKRKIKNEVFLKAVETMQKLDPVPLLSIDVIFDNPFETEDDKIQTINVLKKIEIPYYLGCFSLTYYPKTELYDMAVKTGIMNEELRNSIYNSSYHQLKLDWLNGLILFTSIKYVSADFIDFILRHKSLRYILGMSCMIIYSKLLLPAIPFIRKNVLKLYKK